MSSTKNCSKLELKNCGGELMLLEAVPLYKQRDVIQSGFN
jgi:hypothetical protein